MYIPQKHKKHTSRKQYRHETKQPQVVDAVSRLPMGSSKQSAVAAVRALGSKYAGVTAVESGLVDVLTQHERSPVAGSGEEDDGRQEEEMAHEGLLFGTEVCGKGGDDRGGGGGGERYGNISPVAYLVRGLVVVACKRRWDIQSPIQANLTGTRKARGTIFNPLTATALYLTCHRKFGEKEKVRRSYGEWHYNIIILLTFQETWRGWGW